MKVVGAECTCLEGYCLDENDEWNAQFYLVVKHLYCYIKVTVSQYVL